MATSIMLVVFPYLIENFMQSVLWPETDKSESLYDCSDLTSAHANGNESIHGTIDSLDYSSVCSLVSFDPNKCTNQRVTGGKTQTIHFHLNVFFRFRCQQIFNGETQRLGLGASSSDCFVSQQTRTLQVPISP